MHSKVIIASLVCFLAASFNSGKGIVSDAVKATLRNPKESAFMLGFARASAAASAKRKKRFCPSLFN